MAVGPTSLFEKTAQVDTWERYGTLSSFAAGLTGPRWASTMAMVAGVQSVTVGVRATGCVGGSGVDVLVGGTDASPGGCGVGLVSGADVTSSGGCVVESPTSATAVSGG